MSVIYKKGKKKKKNFKKWKKFETENLFETKLEKNCRVSGSISGFEKLGTALKTNRQITFERKMIYFFVGESDRAEQYPVIRIFLIQLYCMKRETFRL